MPKIPHLFKLADELDASQDKFLSEISGFKPPIRRPAKNFEEAFGSGADEVNFAIVEGTVVGFVSLGTIIEEQSKSTYISGLYVSPKSRGLGVGKALLELALTRGKENHSVALKLQVIATNHAARSLYEKFGFQQVSLFYTKPIKKVTASSAITNW